MNKKFIMFCFAVCNFITINTMDRSSISQEQSKLLKDGTIKYLAARKCTLTSINGNDVCYQDKFGNRRTGKIEDLLEQESYFFRDSSGRIYSRNDNKKVKNNGRSREELTPAEWQEYTRNI